MATQSLTFVLEGNPTIDDYAAALSGFRGLLDSLTKKVAKGAAIIWEVEGLEASSAFTTVRGVSEDLTAVERVTGEYLKVARLFRDFKIVPGYEKPFDRMHALLNSRVQAMRFETAEGEVTVFSDAVVTSAPNAEPTTDYGAVEGRVQTLTSRGGLRFSLYDLVFDKAVSCYLAPGGEDMMRNVWGRVALVEGLVKREPFTGRPIYIRQVSRVSLVEEGRSGGWRAARGVLAAMNSEPSEVTIRRIRDAR